MKPEKKAVDMSVEELASYIDYSVLKPEFTEQEIIDLTKDGVSLKCATICINPAYLDLCEPYVKGSAIRSGKYEEVTKDLKACADVCHSYGKEIKVIFETDALNEEQVRKTCRCCVEAGVDFVKTSTGFLTGYESHGATPEIIKVMMEEVDGKCKVKGSGCIRTREHFLQLIDMGIDRMGVGYKSVPVVLDLNK